MKLNQRERLILVGVLRDREHWAAQDWQGPALRHGAELGAYRIRISDARQGLVAMNAADWLGHALTSSESVMLCRAYKRLETLGLLERCNLGGYSERTSHLRLTEAGEASAREIQQPDRDRERIENALSQTETLIVKAADFVGRYPTNPELQRRFSKLCLHRDDLQQLLADAAKVGVP
ncbi:MAG: hypothetical protein ACKV2Q_33030 [Planctomycetaceae bacterium]